MRPERVLPGIEPGWIHQGIIVPQGKKILHAEGN
jgi:hypothetical protein